MTTDDERTATRIVDTYAQATRRDWSAGDHRLYDIVLTALRARDPGPVDHCPHCGRSWAQFPQPDQYYCAMCNPGGAP